MSYINQDYEAFLETTDDPVAAALLVLASNVEKIANAMSDGGLGHEICMGIRHGLFGAHADDNVSLFHDTLSVIAAVEMHGDD